jgi:flagella basal body P-ring formation protein FlgA
MVIIIKFRYYISKKNINLLKTEIKQVNTMKFIKSILFFISILGATDNFFDIKSEYYFEDNKILSSDMIGDINSSFEVIDIPKNIDTYKVSFDKLKNIYLNNGFEINTDNKTRYITFHRKMTFNEDRVKEYIKTKYYDRYQDIIIDDVFLKSFSYVDIANYTIENISLSLSSLRQDKGSIKVYFINQDKHKKSIFLRYILKANLPALIAKKNISQNELLSVANTQITQAPLSVYNKSLHSIIDNIYYAKQFIKKYSYINISNIKKNPLIKRNTTISLVYNIGAIKATRSVIALKDGYLGDFININLNGKRTKAKIVGVNKVEIQ